MRQSMTGFASASGEGHGVRWSWDVRGVNAKGLDLRVRVPDWIEGLEAGIRAAVPKAVSRGSVSVGLRVTGDAQEDVFRLNPAQMLAVLDALSAIETEAAARGVHLAPSTAADLLLQRGVMEQGGDSADAKALGAELLAQFASVLSDFTEMRAQEGAALVKVLTRQLDDVSDLVTKAEEAVAQRKDAQAEKLTQALARVAAATDVEPERIAQELALIAVKSDVTEELDRLRAHIVAARALLDDAKPVGRRLDFLMQEFNREANTLCSKSQSSALTSIGLALKTLVDQMREQVQNVE